jgi:hypothetical protein
MGVAHFIMRGQIRLAFMGSRTVYGREYAYASKVQPTCIGGPCYFFPVSIR